MSNSDYQTDTAGILGQAIDDAIKRRLLDVHTVIPGLIEAYDKQKQTADVTVAVNRLKVDGEAVTGPKLPNVPVCFPRTSKGHLIWPLQVGDEVAIHFCERDIDSWRTSGQQKNPLSSRKFSLTDSFCVPGLVSDDNAPERDSGDEDNLTLYFGTLKLVLTEDDKVLIGKQGSDQEENLVLGQILKSFVSDWMEVHKTVPSGLTTSPGAPVTVNPAYITALDNLIATYITTASTNILSQTGFTER